jgi:hypothetical protein
MFAKESFYNLSNYPNDYTSKQTKGIQQYYGVTLPNIRFNNDPSMSYVPLTRTVNTRTRNSESVIDDKWNKVIEGYQSGSSLSSSQAACESTGNGDQFDHLTSLESTQDITSELRCGWVYNSSNPNASRGALGFPTGPFNTDAQGTWMWDLRKAKETMHTSICDSIQSCEDLNASIYKQRCGWCSNSGKAVPIIQGTIAYPNSVNSCSQSDLILPGGKCPAQQSITDPYHVRTPAEACIPLSNGALPRNCLMQKVLAAGCSDQGSLYHSLRSGSNSDYTNILTQLPVFNQYQSRAQVPLNATSLKAGKITISDAINEFSRVSDNSMSPANDSLRATARDLCFTKGYFDSYDVCSELQDSSTGPYTLDCLQKAFLREGGQKDGSMYPSPANIGFWNKYQTWGAVKSAIKEMGLSTNSSDRKTQETAMMDYYGIKLENKRTPFFTKDPVCYYGNYYRKLGDFKLGLANNRPDYVMNDEPYRSSDGWILVTSNDWSKIGFRNETFSDIFMTRKDINGVDIVNVLKPIVQQHSIGNNPRQGTTFNFLIKNANNSSSVLVMKASALHNGQYGETMRLTFIHGEYKGNNNPDQLNLINQLQQINGQPNINSDIYELYYTVSSDTCPRKPIIRNPMCYLGYNFRKIGEFKLGTLNDRADYMLFKEPYKNSDGWVFIATNGVNDWMKMADRNESVSNVFLTGKDIHGNDIRDIMLPIARQYNVPLGNLPYGASGPWFNYYLKSKSSSSSIMLMKCGSPFTGSSRITALSGEYSGNNYPNQSIVINQQAYPVGVPKMNSDVYELYYVLNTDRC